VRLATKAPLYELSARARPARLAPLAAILTEWVFVLITGALIALPWNASIRALLRAASPDDVIFRNDPLEMIEMVTRPSGQTSLFVSLVAMMFAIWLAWFLPFGATVSSINTEGPSRATPFSWHVGHAASRFWRTLSVGALFGLLRIVCLVIAVALGLALHATLQKGSNDARADVGALAFASVLALAVVPLSAFEDCLHFARFRGEAHPIAVALNVVRTNFVRLSATFALRTALGLALAMVAWLALRGPFAHKALLVFGVHQLLFVGRATVRAWWLAVASRYVAANAFPETTSDLETVAAEVSS